MLYAIDQMMRGVSFGYAATLHALVTALALLLYVITSRAMGQRRQPAAAISWILFILLLPYVALPAFFAFGSRKRKRDRPAPALPLSQAPRAGSDNWAVETILALGQPAPAPYSLLRIHEDGQQAHDALMENIDSARHSIDICTFLLGRDAFGDAVLKRLCAKALSGVRVRLLLDGLGQVMGGRPKLAALLAAGGSSTIYMSPLRALLRRRANLRIHRKLLITDAGTESARLWCGGRNLATEYFLGGPGRPAWRDLTFDTRGTLVQQASALFDSDWAFGNGQEPPVQAAVEENISTACGAQIVASGPDQADDTVYSILLTAAYRAEQRILLATPYFVPDPALLLALCLAARRGVLVDLLLPERSNHALSDRVRGRALRTLTQAGVRVWCAPTMLHAKLAVVDDVLALAGSANLDSRSLFLNYEVMVAFCSEPDVRRFASWFQTERQTARPYIASPPGLLRDILDGLLLWVAFQL